MTGSPLTLYDMLQTCSHIALCQGRKPEARASGLQCWNDLPHIVADEAEARVPGVLFDDCSVAAV